MAVVSALMRAGIVIRGNDATGMRRDRPARSLDIGPARGTPVDGRHIIEPAARFQRCERRPNRSAQRRALRFPRGVYDERLRIGHFAPEVVIHGTECGHGHQQCRQRLPEIRGHRGFTPVLTRCSPVRLPLQTLYRWQTQAFNTMTSPRPGSGADGGIPYKQTGSFECFQHRRDRADSGQPAGRRTG